LVLTLLGWEGGSSYHLLLVFEAKTVTG